MLWGKKLVAISIIFILFAMVKAEANGQTPTGITLLKLSHDEQLVALRVNNQLIVRAVSDPQSAVTISGYSGEVAALEWNDDASKLAFGTTARPQNVRTSKVYVWDRVTNTIVASSDDQYGLIIKSLLWRAGANVVLCGFVGVDGGGGVYTFDLSTLQLTQFTLTSTPDLSLSADSSHIAYATLGGSIGILNSTTLATELEGPVFPLSAHIHSTCCVAWHPTGSYIASGHVDGRIIIWDTFGNAKNYTLSGASTIHPDANYSASIRALKFDPTGRFLRSINGEGIIRTFDVDTGEILAEKLVTGPVYAAEWNSDASQVVYGTNATDPQIATAAERPIGKE